MFKIKKGDTVQVIKGEDRGKKGKVLKVIPDDKKAIVEGVNLAKKHKRRTRDDQKGGIVSIEMPMHLANLKIFCKNCGRPAKTGFKVLPDGNKSRICKSCSEVI